MAHVSVASRVVSDRVFNDFLHLAALLPSAFDNQVAEAVVSGTAPTAVVLCGTLSSTVDRDVRFGSVLGASHVDAMHVESEREYDREYKHERASSVRVARDAREGTKTMHRFAVFPHDVDTGDAGVWKRQMHSDSTEHGIEVVGASTFARKFQTIAAAAVEMRATLTVCAAFADMHEQSVRQIRESLAEINRAKILERMDVLSTNDMTPAQIESMMLENDAYVASLHPDMFMQVDVVFTEFAHLRTFVTPERMITFDRCPTCACYNVACCGRRMTNHALNWRAAIQPPLRTYAEQPPTFAGIANSMKQHKELTLAKFFGAPPNETASAVQEWLMIAPVVAPAVRLRSQVAFDC